MRIATTTTTHAERHCRTEKRNCVRKIHVAKAAISRISSYQFNTPFYSSPGLSTNNLLIISRLSRGGYSEPIIFKKAVFSSSYANLLGETTTQNEFQRQTEHSIARMECANHVLGYSDTYKLTSEIKAFNPARRKHLAAVGGNFCMRKYKVALSHREKE